MAKPVQKRTLETRARLIGAAEALIGKAGYEALRVEDVVLMAGVAKGTFFAHFKDKDALMDLLIGREIDACLDAIGKRPPPESIDELVETLGPLLRVMGSERYVFDVVIRYSGAAAIEEIGVIGAKELYRSLGTNLEAMALSVREMKNVAMGLLSGEDAEEAGFYFDYVIGALS